MGKKASTFSFGSGCVLIGVRETLLIRLFKLKSVSSVEDST